MTIGFGKYIGRSAAWLVLNAPDYVRWVLGQPDPGRQLAELQREIRNLIAIFNSKPFVQHCAASGCGNAATVATAYFHSPDLMFWCDACDPSQQGAGKLQRVHSYQDVLVFGPVHCGGRKETCEQLVRALAQAKGLPSRVGEWEAEAFFAAVEGA